MIGYGIKTVLTISALFLMMTPDTAEAVKLKHLFSVYFDYQGEGLKAPEGLACNDTTLIVADTGNGRLIKYLSGTETVEGGSEIAIPELPYPIRVQIDSRGEIFVLDGKTRRIAHLDKNGVFKKFLEPQGMPLKTTVIVRSFAIDRDDTIHVLDIFSGRVLVLDREGNYQNHIDFPENYGFISDLLVDDKGVTVLIDSVHAMVFTAPKGSNDFSSLIKNGKDYLNFPTSIATDNKGILYVLDQFGGGVVILGLDGSLQGRQLSMGWKESLLRYPSQVCINNSGKLFIADRSNNRIQVFTLVR